MAGTQDTAVRQARRGDTRLAVILVALVGLSVFAQLWPGAFELDCARVAAGEWWRLLTGNLVHCDWSHQLADMGAFVALSCVVWRQSGRWAAGTLLAAAAVGVAVFALGGVATYRGMSGVDYALLTAALGNAAAAEQGARRTVPLCLLTGVVLKAVVEANTGALTVNVCLPEGVVLVGAAHVAGVLAGLTCVVTAEHARRRHGRLAIV
jgi:rhomboid family GlyGly-CTERM serine protease